MQISRKIKKFEPISVMRIAGICYAGLGLLEGVLFALLFSIVPFTTPPPQNMPRLLGLYFGGFAVILFPILLGATGAIMAGLGAAIYNLTARYVGGIEVEVE